MKHSRNYILSVYTVFIIELLTLICSMAFSESFLGLNTLSIDDLHSNIISLAVACAFFILVDCIMDR